MTPSSGPPSLCLFCGYAPQDKLLHEELDRHLAVLRKSALITTWHTGHIQPGQQRQEEIAQWLDRADLMLLLISADFIGSDFHYEAELLRALGRHDAGTAVVLPVLLRPTDTRGLPLEGLPWLPAGRRAVTEWPNRDQAWVQVIDGVRQAAAALTQRRQQVAPAEGALVGRRIGRYAVIGVLGKGGMGMVYKVRDEVLGKHFALKVLSSRIQHREDLLRRFRAEAQVLSQLHEPGIVQIFEQGQMPDGAPYIVMELLHGESLGARLKAAPTPMAEARALEIVRQIAAILTKVHDQRIIHRDLKPDNIMLVPDARAAGHELVKILDFGIAKLPQEQFGAHTGHTEEGMGMGTPRYMAPEQRFAAAEATESADVYALGVILLQCLSGKLPPAGAPLLPRDLLPRQQRHLLPMIGRMLALKPERRPTMQAVEQELRRAQGRPRHALASALTAAAAAAAAGALGWALVAGMGADPAPAEAGSARRVDAGRDDHPRMSAEVIWSLDLRDARTQAPIDNARCHYEPDPDRPSARALRGALLGSKQPYQLHTERGRGVVYLKINCVDYWPRTNVELPLDRDAARTIKMELLEDP